MWQILKQVGRWVMQLLADPVVRAAIRELIRELVRQQGD